MIRINKDSDWYSVIADCIATALGFGASAIIGSFCNTVIDSSNCGGFKKFGMKAGKYGLETLTVYGTASRMRSEIDDISDGINELMGVIETYQAEKNASSGTDAE